MRWIVRLLSVLLMLVVVAVGVLFLIPSDKVAQVAAQEFGRLTGRVLTIGGAVRPSVWPQLGVRAADVTISNAPWSDAGPMLRTEELEIGLDMAALIGGSVRITSIEAVRPVVLLERNSDGRGNWELGAAAGDAALDAVGVTPDVPGAGTPFTLDRGVISGGSLTFVDHAGGQRVVLGEIDAEAAIPVFNGPATVALDGVMNGQRLAVTGTVQDFAAFLAGRVVPTDLAAKVGGSSIGFKGRLGTGPFVAEGDLVADLADMAALGGVLGTAMPALPAGLGRDSRSISGAVTVTAEGSAHLRGGVVVLDGNRLSGDADLVTGGERPKLSAQISAGALNLAAAGGGGGSGDAAGGGGGAAGAGWSRAPIDVSGLSALDAEIALSADSVDLGNMKLGETRLLATIDRGRAVFDIRRIGAYQGQVSGQFVVNGRSGLSVGGDLTLAGLAMQPLLQDLAGQDRLIGTGDVRIKFLGSGSSVAAIMNSLSGDGRLSFGKGELRGLDLAGMLRTLDAGYVGAGARTIFDSITAGFTIAGGVLRNDDLVVKAPLVTATGSGTVGLGARVLEYRIVPVALAEADGSGGIKVPLLIAGPWSDLKYRLDLESLAEERLKEEAAKLEDEARARIEARAQEELGIVKQEGEDLEAAARRTAREALEKEAAKALGNLFGGGN
ncbi:AsmA family protein [Paracoccaceae bacterium Fryx2]|nr:AsmA family protein [Paracoccaceae bacterium Fryx2]